MFLTQNKKTHLKKTAATNIVVDVSSEGIKTPKNYLKETSFAFRNYLKFFIAKCL